MKPTLFLSFALLALNSVSVGAQTSPNKPVPNLPLPNFNTPSKYTPTAAEEKLSSELQHALRDVLQEARAAAGSGDTGQAVSLFEQAKDIEAKAAHLAHSPTNPDPIEEESLIAQKKYPQAISYFEQHPRETMWDQAWVALLSWNIGERHKAKQAFNKAFPTRNQTDMRQGPAQFLTLNGETESAMHAYTLMFIENRISCDSSRVRDQLKLLQQADDLVPNDPYIAYRIGEAYLHVRQYQNALPYLQVARPGMKPYVEQNGCEIMISDCIRHLNAKQDGDGYFYEMNK